MSRVWFRMVRRTACAVVFLGAATMLLAVALNAQQARPAEGVEVDWSKVVRTSVSTPTLQVVVNPMLIRGAKLHDRSFEALRELGADYVRYVPWLPYPRQAVAELSAPADGKTSWDFQYIDPTLEDFMKATEAEGHSVILNFSTIPAWMWKIEKPVVFPDDPNRVFWDYTQGTELRDPSMKEVADYFARLLSWYTKGGFTDEFGKRHESGHRYKVAYWEVLNEIEFEHHWTPVQYTKLYDEVVLAMRKVDPQVKFVGLALARPDNPEMFEYFLNPAHHKPGVPLDFISYHFYAHPAPEQTLDSWQYTFFDQCEGFLNTVRYAESIRKRNSPTTKTDLDELGVILPEDEKEIHTPGYVAKAEPDGYWNLAGSLYAHLYIELAKTGIEVVGESQLVGYKSQFPSVSMMNYNTAEPNARYWVLKLIKDHFGPGDQLVETKNNNADISVQAFQTKAGKRLLIANKRNRAQEIPLPTDMEGAEVLLVAPSTGDDAPAQAKLSGHVLQMQPFEVAVVTQK